MQIRFPKLRLSFLATLALMAVITPAPADNEEVLDLTEGADISKQQKVHCEVGLSIRKKPDYNSPRVALLEDNDKVTVAGAKTDDPKIVGVTLLPDASEAQTYWIEIVKPKAGFVLYQTVDSNGVYEYLVPD